METVNKYVSAASTAIWGENSPSTDPHNLQHGEEPISGVQGSGRITDPYDGGNREEQPGAINLDGNTATQEPKSDGAMQKTFEEAAVSSAPSHPKSTLDNNNTTGVIDPSATIGKPITSGANTNSSTDTGTIDPTASITKPLTEPNTSTAPVSAEATQPLPGQEAGSSSGPTETAASTKEQRSTTETENAAFSESATEGGSHTAASEEALKGPQGPAPKSAEDFQKEGNRKGSVVKELDNTKDHEKRTSYESKDSNKESSKSDHSSQDSGKGNGKHGAISKMKEGIKKHLHHSSK
ncbi:uncharacterized protein N7511_006170 [Penicillium nucicola]|uniref:uncharacterized protein n=1 Tax=Penicillium nucicola TaxID=1850975 RepID=UPI00254527FA|nr:uncharacterized protein N7511_006170 [Penicillium nucicola]KAJ5757476.1 hypothetical protein N7511_006170 [Penicillium nucicola]